MTMNAKTEPITITPNVGDLAAAGATTTSGIFMYIYNIVILAFQDSMQQEGQRIISKRATMSSAVMLSQLPKKPP